jgi:hypothetical protein
MKASITEGKEQSPYGQVELYWAAPDKFRRTILSKDFSQTLIVNGKEVSETDSTDYFPLQLATFVTAMVNPKPIIDAVQQGDLVLTKSNRAVNDSGITCLGPNHTICIQDPNGLRETVAASGHPVAFADYRPFRGKRVARILTNAPRLGEELMTLNVTELDELASPELSLFQVDKETPPQAQIRISSFTQVDLEQAALGGREVIWPQPLDGDQKGAASFFVSIDRSGVVREVQPLYTANERTNDSAVRQLRNWKFKPFLKNGLPTQAEGVLAFDLDTRAWGPPNPLTDEEARKLASNTAEPEIASGTYPPGTVYSLWVAVDSDGYVIEVMAGNGPHDLYRPCGQALGHWHFSPLIENGQPRPYRAQITFRTH